MKKIYEAKFWRGNPQLKGGGYTTTERYEAETKAEARKMAQNSIRHTVYGTLELVSLERVKD